MTLIWLILWFIFGMPRPQMFTTRWDIWGITLAVVVVADSAWLRDWLHEGSHVIVTSGRLGRALRFLQHFVEMGLAMVLGMFALGPVSAALHLDSPVIYLLAMALFMTIPMVAWMRIRGHEWEMGAEMAGAMFVPTFLVITLGAIGILPAMAMLSLGHELMWFAMLGVMLFRWTPYAGETRVHEAPATPAQVLTLKEMR
jgi:hypothetical protein